MELNSLRDEAFSIATEKGFHGKDQDDLIKKLMLVNCELCEAVEAERSGQGVWCMDIGMEIPSPDEFRLIYKGSIEEEIADAIIRLADIAAMIHMDLSWWVRAKMDYNRSRPYKHGKEY